MPLHIWGNVNLFSWVDYLLLGLLLALSTAVGIFFGLYRKQKDNNAYLMASKSMGVIPVALSLLSSFMSGISLLGLSSEVYTFGTSIWMSGLCYFAVIPATCYLYLPVYWKLQVTSAFQYVEIRFHRSIRLIASFLMLLQMLLYMAIVIYTPALALVQVVGLDLYLSVTLTCSVCIFYTALGGIKAVIWTDVLQGTISVGGISNVWKKNEESGRLQWFIWDMDLTVRHTFWSVAIGNTFHWLNVFATNQAQVQRYLCVKRMDMAKKALWINFFGIPILSWLCVYSGMIAYAKYWDCDPLSTQKISKSDQILPLFVMEVLGKWKGLPGCFVAAVFSGTLSTVSSGINAMAAMVLQDFILPNVRQMTPTRETTVSKLLSLALGLLCFGLVFVMEKMGNILSITVSMFGILGGPVLGLFSLGMFFPVANKYGAGIGTLLSLIISLWLGIGSQMARLQGQIHQPYMPVSTEGCLQSNFSLLYPENLTLITTTDNANINEDLFIGYRLSYFVFGGLGCISCIVIGLLVSVLTGGQDIKKLDPRTLTPAVLWIGRRFHIMKDLGADLDLRETIEENSDKNIGLDNLTYDNSNNT